jgi:methionyl-tRNA formyltransferase
MSENRAELAVGSAAFKICLLVNQDLASNLALNQLLPRLARQHQLRVYLSSKVGAQRELPPELSMLAFLEQGLFRDLLFPALDKGDSAGGLLSFEQLSRYTDQSIRTLNQINSEDSLAELSGFSADLILSIRYGGILREQAIALPNMGVINLHSGLLPDYRGVMATFRAMLHGEREIGTTLHYISDPGIDTGDIIGTTRLPVEPKHSYLWHVLNLYPPACERLLGCVEQLAAGQSLDRQAQPAGGNYFSFPGEAELRAFNDRGLKLYDVEELTAFARQYLE